VFRSSRVRRQRPIDHDDRERGDEEDEECEGAGGRHGTILIRNMLATNARVEREGRRGHMPATPFA